MNIGSVFESRFPNQREGWKVWPLTLLLGSSTGSGEDQSIERVSLPGRISAFLHCGLEARLVGYKGDSH